MEGRVRDLQAEIGYIYEDTKFQNKNYYEERNEQIRSEIKKASSNFIMDIEEICEKYLEDFEPREYISKSTIYMFNTFIFIKIPSKTKNTIKCCSYKKDREASKS